MKNATRKKLIQNYYSKRAKDYDKQKRRTWKSEQGFGTEIINEVVDAVKSLRNKSILEVGVGSGRISLPLLEKVAPWLVGLDLSREMLKLAGTKMVSCKQKFDLILGDAEHPPFIDKAFEAVVCVSTLHYFAESEKSSTVFSRILKEKGIFVYGDLTLHELDERGFLDALEKTLSKAHARYYKPSVVKKILEKCGFHVLRTRTVSYRKSYLALMEDKGTYFGVKPQALRKIIRSASKQERKLYELDNNELTLYYTLITASKESKS